MTDATEGDTAEGVPQTMPPPQPNGDLVPINPEKLTPASTRALHKIDNRFLRGRIAYVILFVAMFLALGVVSRTSTSHAVCIAKRTVWDQDRKAYTIQTKPIITAGFTDGVLESREQANRDRKANRVELYASQGLRPSC